MQPDVKQSYCWHPKVDFLLINRTYSSFIQPTVHHSTLPKLTNLPCCTFYLHLVRQNEVQHMQKRFSPYHVLISPSSYKGVYIFCLKVSNTKKKRPSHGKKNCNISSVIADYHYANIYNVSVKEYRSLILVPFLDYL